MLKSDSAILIACEQSGAVRRAFASLGYREVWSCDLQPAEDGSDNHIQGDLIPVLSDAWDLIVAFPPCTYLCSSGLHWNKRIPGREAKTQAALDFVREIMRNPCPRIAIENPVGKISTVIRKPDQYVEPWQFGDGYTKKTGFWLKGLPLLQPTNIVPVDRPNWIHNQPATKHRSKIRSITPPGLAMAMAQQWSK